LCTSGNNNSINLACCCFQKCICVW